MIQYRIYNPNTEWASKPIDKHTADYINAYKSMCIPPGWTIVKTYNGK